MNWLKKYGELEVKDIISNIKLIIIYQKLLSIKSKSISFDELNSKYLISLEDFEEVIMDGGENNSIKITISYEKKVN